MFVILPCEGDANVAPLENNNAEKTKDNNVMYFNFIISLNICFIIPIIKGKVKNKGG